MPLTRARDNYTVRADGIQFLMRDGQFEVICQIGMETLSQYGNATSLVELIEIFQRDRATIERAASHKYDGTSRQDYEIVAVTIVDLMSRPGQSG
jgi:Protein of unknown function (DUF1488)